MRRSVLLASSCGWPRWRRPASRKRRPTPAASTRRCSTRRGCRFSAPRSPRRCRPAISAGHRPSSNERFTHRRADARCLHGARLGAGLSDAGRVRSTSRRSRHRPSKCGSGRPAHRAARRHADPLGAAHRRCSGQHQRRDQRADPAVARRRRRRRAAAGADVQPVPPHQQHRRQPDGAGRVAARRRPERRQPHARAARRHPVQRSVRRLGATGRACR